MHSAAQTAVQLTLCCVLTVLLQMTNASRVTTPYEVANEECTSDQYLCGCQAVPSSEYSRFGEFFHQSVDCSPLCGQQSCYQTCEKSACVFPMGSLGEWCAAIVDQKMVDYVRGATCYHDMRRRMTKCMKMTSVTYPDDQTYQAITQGYCIPTCGMDVGSIQCTFEGRFQDTSITPDRMPHPPFTIITGIDFKHYGSEGKVSASSHQHSEGHGATAVGSQSHMSASSSKSEEASTDPRPSPHASRFAYSSSKSSAHASSGSHQTASSSSHSAATATPHTATKTVDCSTTDEYLCGCQAVPSHELPKFNEFFKSKLSCSPLCTQESCYQTCEKSACVSPMNGQLSCAAIIDQAMVDFVRSADCIYDPGMMMYECVKGGSLTYPDKQTYTAIAEGYCIPVCEINTGLIQCTFEPRFRDSYIYDSDLPVSPFTVITGTDFHHWGLSKTMRGSLAAGNEAESRHSFSTETEVSGSARESNVRSVLSVGYDSASNVEPAGCSSDYLCGCQVVPDSIYSRFQYFFQQTVQCPQLCEQQSCSQSCEQSVCVYPMGSQGQWCGGIIDQAMVDFVRESSCTFERSMTMYGCVKAGSETHPDEQTYMAITTGHCVPACGLDIDKIRCTFSGRFRYTSISASELKKSPFTVVTGLDFQHWEAKTEETTVTTVIEEPEAPVTEVPETHEEEPKVVEKKPQKITPVHEAKEEVKKWVRKPTEPVTEKPEEETTVTVTTEEEPSAEAETAETTTETETVVPEVTEIAGQEEEPSETETTETTTETETVEAEVTEQEEEPTAVVVKPAEEEEPTAVVVKPAEEEETTVEEVPGETGTSKKARTRETTEEATEQPTEAVKAPEKKESVKKKEKKEEEETTETEEQATSVEAEAQTEVAVGAEEEAGTEEEEEVRLGTLSVPEPEEPGIEETTEEEESTGTEESEQRQTTTTATTETTTTRTTERTGRGEEEAESAEETETGTERTEQTTVTTEETTVAEITTETEETGTEEAAEEEEEEVTTAEEVPTLPPNDNFLYYGPFGECSQICSQAGPGYKERSIICRNHAGVPVSMDKCDLPEDFNTEFYEECELEGCGPKNYIFLSDWSECPKKCAAVMSDGTSIPNRSYREVECRRVRDNQTLDTNQCSNMLARLGIQTRKTCNSIPCIRYGYKVGNWKACDCEKWSQTRDVTCVRLPDGRAVSASMCDGYKLEPPASERRCFPKQCFNEGGADGEAASDYCQFSQCSQKGECKDGQCTCKWGFDGDDCQEDIRSRPKCASPSLWNKDGSCCASGVFDTSGACCEGTNEEVDCDIRGECCQGRALDGCGFCSEENPRFIDSNGQCCEVLDASGTCCESGHVDECGVCDGSGTSCKSKIDFNVKLTREQDMESCGNELGSVITEAFNLTELTWTRQIKGRQRISFTNRNVAYSSGFIWHKVDSVLQDKDLDAICDVQDVKTSRVSVCGNGICEIGEPMSCARDCDYGIQLCEKQRGRFNEPIMCNGHGLCSIKTAECICFDGYEGKNCEKCSKGFFHVGGDGRCIATEAFMSRPKLDEDKQPISTYLFSSQPILVI